MINDNSISNLEWIENRLKKFDQAAAALEEAIAGYLDWVVVNGYAQSTHKSHKSILNKFLSFVRSGKYLWDDIFTLQTFEDFKKAMGLNGISALTGLSRYLFEKGKITEPIVLRKPLPHLPPLYEDYLAYQQKYRQTSNLLTNQIRRVLCFFERYLKDNGFKLRTLTIEKIDAFQAAAFEKYAPATCGFYRCHLKRFLSYLYHERRILTRDLGPLVVGRREYADAKPPKFLRPAEVKTLFASLDTSSPTGIRTYATAHLAYTMGLRPIEISKICLNDFSFSRQVLAVKVRKEDNPVELPVPEHTVKAVAAYVIGVRPQTKHRALFLTLHPPFRPICPGAVGHQISKAMKKAGLNASAYWLRHTYAQNMMEAGTSIFEIKEMLGHDKIESTKRYLRVHTKLMRKVLFDEEIL